MVYDPELTDQLSSFPSEAFKGEVFRATRLSLDPLLFSTRSGRWMPENRTAVLYTSLEGDGALAEISFHLAQQTPLPSKPVSLHKLRVATDKTLRLVRTDLDRLGVEPAKFGEFGYPRTQERRISEQLWHFSGTMA